MYKTTETYFLPKNCCNRCTVAGQGYSGFLVTFVYRPLGPLGYTNMYQAVGLWVGLLRFYLEVKKILGDPV